jgi:hypothetical protein
MITFNGTGGTGGVLSTIPDMWEYWETRLETGFANNDPQTVWTGQLQGFNMAEANTTIAPLFRTNQINGHAATRFEAGRNIKTPRGPGPGFNNRFSTDLIVAHTFFIVRVDNDPPANNLQSGFHFNTSLTDVGGFAEELFPFTNGVVHENWGSTTRQDCGNPATALTQWNVYEIFTGPGEYIVRLNGTDLPNSPFAVNTVGWPTGDAGWVGVNINPLRFMEGDIAGIYVASAKLTTDRTTLIDYFNDPANFNTSSL